MSFHFYQRSIVSCATGLLGLVLLAGCTTTHTSNTDRTALEQLLISNAVDASLDRIDFSPLTGHSVFLNSSLIDCVDKNYVVATTRARILQSGAKLVDKQENAEIVVEIRSGAVGTNESKSFVGMPKLSIPGPMPIALPEVKLWSKTQQTGTAKIGMVAYDAKSHEIVGSGGTILARSDDSKTYFMGIGPWQSGSVRKEIRTQLGRPGWSPLPDPVAFLVPVGWREPVELKLAGGATPKPSTDQQDSKVMVASHETPATPENPTSNPESGKATAGVAETKP